MKPLSVFTVALTSLIYQAGPGSAQTELTMWYHGARNKAESAIIRQIIADFNTTQSDWTVSSASFPQGSYSDAVFEAAQTGKLPDIIDVDAPIMPDWAWWGYIQPINFKNFTREDFLPGAIGIWDGEIYSIGLWDAAVALYTRQSTLDLLELRKPTLEQPWSRDEFMAAMDAAKTSGEFDQALDLGMAWTGEWYPYAFSPFLQSFGGDIIDRTTYLTAEGALNGDAAKEFGEWWQSLFSKGYVQASQSLDERKTGFIEGRYAFSWSGNWTAIETINSVNDVVFLPAPDFGNGPTIGSGSWQLAISSDTEHADGASAFIEFAAQDQYLAAFSDSVGLIPPTAGATAMSENYKDGGPLNVFFSLSETQALARPIYPGYGVAAKAFQKAITDIANGADVSQTLDAAVEKINADIEKNRGYGSSTTTKPQQ